LVRLLSDELADGCIHFYRPLQRRHMPGVRDLNESSARQLLGDLTHLSRR